METVSVLVVDDEPGIRSGIKRILSSHVVSFPFMDEDYTFECLEASTGEEALKILEQKLPDILLLDNKLPGTDATSERQITLSQLDSRGGTTFSPQPWGLSITHIFVSG